ncbi:MAG: MBL fold metallo-hydrolase [bacterium]
MKVKFWGTRGSIPVPGEKTVIYGGNTPCIQVISKHGSSIIIDAGTGIRNLGIELLSGNHSKELNIFISHSHWDHIQGIPFFLPFFRKDFKINIFSNTCNNMDVAHIIDSQMHPFYFPVNKEEVFKSDINYFKIKPNEFYHFDGLTIETAKVHHSQGTLAFKITEDDKSVVYMTDNEIFYNALDSKPDTELIYKLNKEQLDFCKDADYLIHDSQYTLDDFDKKIGWGHSNNIALSYFSILANVKNLLLFHYDPDYSDKMVEMLLKSTQIFLKDKNSSVNCIASKELLEIDI